MISTLLQALTNLGALPADANVLEAYYANQDIGDFLNGLEEVSRALVFKQLNTLVPVCEPWKTVYSYMIATGSPDQGLLDGMAALDPAVQIAVTGIINNRMRDLQQYQNQISAPGSKRKKTAEYIKLLGHLGYKFRYNEARQTTEINGIPMTDETMMTIRTQVRDAGVMETNIVEDAYQADAWANRYHPIKDYLQDLSWDGQDTISKVAACFQDERGVFSSFFKRWLIGAVARVFQGSQNRVLVLEGPQGLGKSEFVRWLCSGAGREHYYEGPIKPDDKDTWLRLISTWIWEVNEFGSTTRKADREQLKQFITTEVIKVRKAYARADTVGRAMSSFIGTANNEMGLLNDPTGSRRFMVIHVTGIDWQSYAFGKIDVDQVWAQAYVLYLADEPWDLQPDEKKIADEINESYRVVDLVEEAIQRFFEIDLSQTTWKLATIDIMETLKDPFRGNMKPGTELDGRRLAAALTKLGLERPKVFRIGNTTMRGYSGIKFRTP
jgi:hypothetical protein